MADHEAVSHVIHSTLGSFRTWENSAKNHGGCPSEESQADELVRRLRRTGGLTQQTAEILNTRLREGGLFHAIGELLPPLPADWDDDPTFDSWGSMEPWWKATWGYDVSFLLLLSVWYNSGKNRAEKLGGLLSPFPLQLAQAAEYRSEPHDAHLHVGALGLPCLAWLAVMNSPRPDILNTMKGAEGPDELSGDRGMARLVGAQACLYLMLQVAAGEALDEPEEPLRKFLQIIRSIDHDQGPSELAGKVIRGSLEPERCGEAIQELEEGWFMEAQRAVELEREAMIEALSSEEDLHREVLAFYLRTKNTWISWMTQGPDGSGRGYDDMAASKDEAWAMIDPGDKDLMKWFGELVGWWYATEYPDEEVRLDVRVPVPQPDAPTGRTIRWLQQTLAGQDLRVFLATSRFPADSQGVPGDLQDQLEKIEHEIKAVCALEGLDQVEGVDIVGREPGSLIEAQTELLVGMASTVEAYQENRPIRAIHCGECTTHPMKGLLDIWSAIDRCNFTGEDRIGHALDLLADIDTAPGTTSVAPRDWSDIVRLGSLRIDELGDAGLRKIWLECLAGSQWRAGRVEASTKDLAELSTALRDRLLGVIEEREINIEVCPTSNWKLIDKVPSPDQHPARAEMITSERLLFGTDDPQIMPAVIQMETWFIRS